MSSSATTTSACAQIMVRATWHWSSASRSTLIRRRPSGKDSLTVKRKKAGWSIAYLIETIAGCNSWHRAAEPVTEIKMHGIDPAARSDIPVGSPIAHTDGIANSMVRTRRHDAGDLGHEA